MDLISDGARLPTLALMVSMALAGAAATADDRVKTLPAIDVVAIVLDRNAAPPTCSAAVQLAGL